MVATQAPHARQTTRVHLDRQRDARGRLQARARRCREHLSSSLHRCGYRVCCLIAYRKAPAAAPAARSPPACTRPARRAAAAADADAAARRAKTRLALHWKRHWQPQKTRAALYRSLRPRGGSTGAIRGIQGAGDSSGTVAASHLGTSTLCSAAARTQSSCMPAPSPHFSPSVTSKHTNRAVGSFCPARPDTAAAQDGVPSPPGGYCERAAVLCSCCRVVGNALERPPMPSPSPPPPSSLPFPKPWKHAILTIRSGQGRPGALRHAAHRSGW